LSLPHGHPEDPGKFHWMEMESGFHSCKKYRRPSSYKGIGFFWLTVVRSQSICPPLLGLQLEQHYTRESRGEKLLTSSLNTKERVWGSHIPLKGTLPKTHKLLCKPQFSTSQ
jgi:hypothetical protein